MWIECYRKQFRVFYSSSENSQALGSIDKNQFDSMSNVSTPKYIILRLTEAIHLEFKSHIVGSKEICFSSIFPSTSEVFRTQIETNDPHGFRVTLQIKSKSLSSKKKFDHFIFRWENGEAADNGSQNDIVKMNIKGAFTQ